ncbi:MAG: gliding motility protein GldM [Vicingaceae bacterium]
MASGKLPPRQKMIGLMYLVLLALLAMNVSKSILESFVIINNGIETTAETFVASNEVLYAAFDKAAQESPAAKSWQTKAEKVKKSANELVTHIDLIKKKMYQAIDGLPDEAMDTMKLANVAAKDNYDEPTRLMGIAEPATPSSVPDCEECSSTLLKQKLNDYQAGLLALFEDKNVKDDIESKIAFLSTPVMVDHEGKDSPWEVAMFYHNPLAAVATTLSKIQSDVRTAEAQVINRLYENIDAGGVSFNNVVGMAVLPKAYLTPSDSFTADIFTAAYDDRVNPDIYIYSSENGGVDSALLASGETDINKLMKGTKGTAWGDGDWYQMDEKEVIEGKGNLKIKPTIGAHNWGGLIKLKTKKGPKVYDFKSSFEVGVPSFAVSADKMNVFYMGVDNPVSVSAPMPKFTASGPGLSKSGKGWIMRPKKPGNVKINVTGVDEATGKNIAVGSKEFRVKRIPTPVAFVAGKTGTITLSKSQLGNGVIQAKLEGFVFDLRVKCKSFELGTTVNGDYKNVKITGNKMNSNAKSLIKRSSRGQRFYLEKMAVKMPDGRTVTMGNMTVKIK